MLCWVSLGCRVSEVRVPIKNMTGCDCRNGKKIELKLEVQYELSGM